MKKLIIYDLDGTLVDTRRDIINGVRYWDEVSIPFIEPRGIERSPPHR
ncbi:MAG: hypothetical protein BWY42_00132 [Candidatus Omnitrophica bacterium ADurb.Bin277]|nr:MAG: hypothetical protein BWY42_00132 [Candidatus Omnitrophica bacterium ADurb.Bin277]